MWTVAVMIGAAAAAVEPRVVVLAAAILIAVVTWRWPERVMAISVAGILVVRPVLDTFSERRLGLSVWAVNPAVAFGGAVLLVGVVVGGQRLLAGRRLWPDRESWRAHWWLALAYVIGLTSGARYYGALGLSDGLRDVLRMASVVAGFLVMTWWTGSRPERVRASWFWLCLGAIVPVSVALWQLATGQGSTPELGVNRLAGTFSHPNTFGTYLVPFVLILSATLTTGRGVLRAGRLVVAAALTVLIALTYSRTALLVLLAGLLLLPLLHAPQLGWATARKLLLAVLVVGAMGWALVGRVAMQRFSGLSVGRAAVEQAQLGESENSFEWRLINWGVLIGLGLRHPLVGHGIGMTTEINPLVSTENGLPINAHNDFVRFFVESGAVGVLAYTLYGGLLCLCAFRRARRAGPTAAPTAYAITAAWIAIVFLSLGTTEVSLSTAVLYELYAMLTLIGVAAGGSADRAAA